VRCVRHGVRGLRHPLGMLDHLLNRHGPWYRVDHRRLNHALGSVREADGERDAVAERHVLVEAWPRHRHSIEAGNPRAIEERRRTRSKHRADAVCAEDRRQSIALDARSPRDIEHAHVNARLDGQELGPVDPAERLPEIIDARGVQVRNAVAVRVHTDLDDPDQLHQIRDGLPLPVAVPDD
jgi:hypothetical protein